MDKYQLHNDNKKRKMMKKTTIAGGFLIAGLLGGDVYGSNGFIYALWISPNKGKVELVIQGESKYVQLNKEKSAKLFNIVAGKELSDE